MIGDYFDIAIQRIKHKKLRSALTILGIVIGVSLVVVLTSLSQGMQEAITAQFDFLGYNILLIEPGAGFITNFGVATQTSIILDKNDLDVIKKTNGIENAAGVIMSNTQVEFKGKKMFTMVRGTPTDSASEKLLRDTFSRVEQGDQLKSSDKDKAVVGYGITTEDSIFDKAASIGDEIKINGKSFKIVGVLKKVGDSHPDNVISIPQDTARELFNKPDEFNMIMARTSKGYNTEDVAKSVEENLRRFRHLKEGEEDFKVTASSQIISGFKSVILIVEIVVIAIALISIIVGGINIMNTMYTSVLERTREIGVMKSIGAKNSHIMFLFMIESGLYGLIGGIIGAGIGLSFAKLIEYFISQKLAVGFFAASVNPWIIIGALSFSFLIGMISGITPARQASKLNPIEAIRYE